MNEQPIIINLKNSSESLAVAPGSHKGWHDYTGVEEAKWELGYSGDTFSSPSSGEISGKLYHSLNLVFIE